MFPPRPLRWSSFAPVRAVPRSALDSPRGCTVLHSAGISSPALAVEGENFLHLLRSPSSAGTSFLSDVPALAIAVDLTLGMTSLTLARQATAPPGAWMLSCLHRTISQDGRVDCWPKSPHP